ncbi:kinesin family protein, putative [Ichthyophthirius multifiliis]|uniref:Kinesin family protein, putative n=1 Tax=Ichthyophthirius multifiliis TaxID=5932 RepID=G0QNE3_ICHMU|nr:kinesin family protein, putative [Ichthyophthirius multifiliis]EGR33276.1 kinesin family protein, putative [Ichthyophthirius multifiliis]|eukprot:XP_004037262.1 kinesin family protein, putative [Ichthyophthirius multifiliis]
MQEEEDNQKNRNFQVCVRIRPSNQKENQRKFLYCTEDTVKKQKKQKKKTKNNKITLQNLTHQKLKNQQKTFNFDYVFDENIQTDFLFEKAIQPSIQNILNGYNYTIFAYGPTSTGKSHTIFGNFQQEGITFLIIRQLFQNNIGKFKFSYLQIYNENIKDLIPQKNYSYEQSLMIIEDPSKGVFVPDLSEYIIENEENVKNLIFLGNKRRTMASTSQNQFSSRSHAIIQISDLQKGTKITIIDLAGSEKNEKNQQMQTAEGSNINKSLLALGNCINLLSDCNKKGCFVPYRDSKLTRLLKDSLGGNTRNIIISCISGNYMSYQETINTLKYVERARNIQKNVVVVQENKINLIPFEEQEEELIKQEIRNLKQQYIYFEKQPFLSSKNINLNTSIDFLDNKCKNYYILIKKIKNIINYIICINIYQIQVMIN